MIIDTHTHIYSADFDADFEDMMARAIQAGVGLFLLPAIDNGTHQKMIALAELHANLKLMMGLHPCSVRENFEEELAIAKNYLDHQPEKFIAVGEIGIDLFWDKTTLTWQQEAFRTQLRWAKEKKLPVAIHIRNSFDEVFQMLEEEKTDDLTGVLHCFTGGKRHVAQARALGFYMGIGGVVTYPNSGIDHVLKKIKIDEIVLETDAPYLTPVPYKGQRNEPAYLIHIAQKVADIKHIPVGEVIEITTQNAKKLFKI